MSKAIICDRCKGIFSAPPNGHVFVTAAVDTPIIFNPCFDKAPEKWPGLNRRYDLCEKCAAEFVKFIRLEEAEIGI